MPRRTLLRVTPLEDRTVPTSLPPGFTEGLVAGGLEAPTAMAVAPDGRIFVAEQTGAVRVITSSGVLPTPFYTVPAQTNAGERGLLGIALDPNFAATGHVYLYYTAHPTRPGLPAFNRVIRVTAAGDAAAPRSERVIADLDPVAAHINHNGGAMQFGPDGKLYVSTGDNLDPAAPQSLTSRHGKILRYNPDGSIPADNPTSFPGVAGTTTGANRAVWAIGLRNPFTFAFDPRSGRMFINDVGADAWEEVNEGAAGRNYGWPRTEGDFDPVAHPGLTRPLFAYPHGMGSDVGFAVTGAAFYAPPRPTFPAGYAGSYFFGDFVSNWVRRLDPASGTVAPFAADLTGVGLVDLDVTPDGDLLYLARGNSRGDGPVTTFDGGAIYRITHTPGPQISRPPAPTVAQVGEPAEFTVAADGGPGLTYQWQRDGVDIPGATGPTLTLPAVGLSDTGARFRVVVRDGSGAVVSPEARLTATTDRRPAPVIRTPAADARFVAGRELAFAGSAADPEDGELPASAFTWRVDYFTGNAPARPLTEVAGVAAGSVALPASSPYTRPDVFYRVSLTVRDSAGNTATTSRDVHPVTVPVTLGSSLPGAVLTLDGQPAEAPRVFTAVAGLERQLGAPAEVTADGRAWLFAGWSDGSADNPRTVAPTRAATFTAVFTPRPDGAGPPGAAPGGVRAAAADLTGDGTPDFVYGDGPGRGSGVVLVDGATARTFQAFPAFEPGFTGGVHVAAADIDGDGKADVIVTPDQGGGPRVRVLRAADLGVIADFYGIDDPAFRGGARVAAADLTGDRRADLVVAAGGGGGPRVAGWDGAALAAGRRVRAFADFFAFEEGLRNGVYVAAADVDGDGRADVIAGSGAGGGPRLRVLAGADLAAGRERALGSFFAGDPAARDGVRVGATDVDGDGKADVIAAVGGVTHGYRGGDLAPAGRPRPDWEWPGSGLPAGVYVG